jgi:hypothetical protein
MCSWCVKGTGNCTCQMNCGDPSCPKPKVTSPK